MDLKNKTYFIQRTDLIKDFLKDISKYKVLSREEEKNLFKAYNESENEDERIEIRNKIIMANQRFVFAIAKRYATDDTLIDLVNVGNLGLFAAFNDYDLTLGYRFTTMACNYVRRQINGYLSKEGLVVRPTNNTVYTSKIKNIEQDFYAKYGRKPLANEVVNILSEQFDIDVKNTSDIHGATTYSIDDLVNDDDEDITDYSEFASVSASHNDYLDTMEHEDISYKMQQALSTLDEREQTIMKMASGTFGYDKEYKDKEIAEVLGLSTERVRQLRISAKNKMASSLAYSRA